MIEIHPRNFILLGFILVLFGFVAPLLMVIRVIQPNYVLSFLSYAASIVGLLLGLIGSASYVHRHKR
jgi:carbon starvation protein CstA